MIKWSERHCVGVESIDLQHRYFIDLINRLSCELEHPDDREYQRMLLDELCQFAQIHFISEENIMHKLRYPHMAEHRDKHVELLDKLSGQIGMYSVGLMAPAEVVCYLTTWFATHLVKEDKQLADFILKAG